MTTETKPLCIVRAPCATRSGYGDMSRDIIRHLIEYDKYDVKVISVNWGETPMNALDEDTPRNKMILDRIISGPLTQQPDLFVTITIPSEFEPIGKFNIGITAGIETTIASAQWIEACNKMDVIFTISEHSKNVLSSSKFSVRGKGGEQLGIVELTKPIEVLHNCIDQKIFKKLDYEAELAPEIKTLLKAVPEEFCYLFVGHWLRGDIGEDRKNVGLLIKVFLETFKQIKSDKPPALILKTSGGSFSYLDRAEILKKIELIRSTIRPDEDRPLANIYVLHGELTDDEMNSLYNHPKVKAHVSLTKGEGFGRPLLEASISGKPVIASGWSGQLDFLNVEDAMLIGGELKPIHPSAVWDNILIKESSWFYPDTQQAANGIAAVFLEYETYRKKAAKLGKDNFKKFSYAAIQKRTWELLDTYVPQFPVRVPLALPKLKKIQLPTLTQNIDSENTNAG
jgi:glycosyltransferase involved in cell wall biosynthesis